MKNESTSVDYTMLLKQLDALTDGEPDRLANTANFVALVANALPAINWTGVYVLRGETLVLGPFQGKPACRRIPLGKGVCGTAARDRVTVRVADVQAFPGHIACDAESASELVVPLIGNSQLFGVLDIDSPSIARFDKRDQRGIEMLCQHFITGLLGTGPLSQPFI